MSLIEEVKLKCYITDYDELSEIKINNILKNALPKVKRWLGVPSSFNFEEAGNEEEKALLLNFCWYDWNDSSNEFPINYQEDINSLRLKYLNEI